MAVINPQWITKQTGSSQTATEMNAIAEAIKNNAVELETNITNTNAKVNKTTTINNKALTDNIVLGKNDIGLNNVDNTSDLNKPISTATKNYVDTLNSAINTRVDNIEIDASFVKVTGSEVECGIFDMFGEKHTIYERTFQLTALPTASGTTKSYIIAEEPLGMNLYTSIEDIVVSTSKLIAKSDFYTSSFTVAKIYINDSMQTVVTIKCNEDIAVSNLNLLLHLRYVKFFGDTVELNVTVPAGIDPSTVSLEFPKLKYNKKIVCSWTTDDSYNIWNNFYNLINKKFVSNELGINPFTGGNPDYPFYYHLGMAHDMYSMTGYVPDKFLEYTDGAGIKHRFASTLATWQWNLNTRDGQVDGFIPWCTAKEARTMADFGFTLGYHDLQDYDGSGQTNFDNALTKDATVFKTLTDRTPKVMIEPNGDHKYLTFSKNNPIIQMMIAQTGDDQINTVFPFKSDFTLDKNTLTTVQRQFNPENGTYVSDMIARLQTEHDSAEDLRTWLICANHKTSTMEQSFLKSVEERFGVTGDDSIWFPSVDEFFEYWFMRSNSVATKSVSGQTIKFKLTIPTSNNFWFKSLSVLLSGISNLTGVSVISSSNCPGTSYAINSGKLLVNLDFNPDLLTKVEKYVSKFESTLDLFDGEDAQYFVQMLKPGVREPYQARIDTLAAAPTLTSMSINSGATSTSSQAVTVTPTYSGNATHYMISENSSFTDASWITMVSSIPLTLTDVAGSHTIYLKLKNANGESSSASASITYNKVAFALSSISINLDAANTTNQLISIALTLAGDVPTHYMASEDAAFIGGSWVAFTSSTIPFTLSNTIGAHTVYVKVKTATETSATRSDSINLIVGVGLTSISINSGASSTTSQTVSVAMTTTGTPTHYMLSESSSFTGASWVTFVTPASFTVSTGYAQKTIYCKVKDANSESSVASSSITYEQAVVVGRKVLIAAVGDSGIVDTVGWVNKGQVSYNSGDLTVKDTDGVDFCLEQDQYYDYNKAPMDILRSKFGVTSEVRADQGYWGQPTSFSTTGTYPDSMITTNKWGIVMFSAATSLLPETRIACHYLKGVPAGTYRVRLLVTRNSSRGTGNGNYMKFKVNDQVQNASTDSAYYLNNNSNWYVFDNITVADGYMMIGSYNEPPTAGSTDAQYWSEPIVIIEITRTA